MKKYLNGILVIEGKEDACYLSNYIGSEIVSLNGYEMKDNTIEYLIHASKTTNIILLTDPDSAGIKIREKMNSHIPNCINIMVDINKCTKGNKNGVAECEINEVLKNLSPLFVEQKTPNINITIAELFDLKLIGENSSKLRMKVTKTLNLGTCNSKTLLTRLNNLGINSEDLKRCIKECANDN